ncbi:MAG: 6-carboxytetrahydropterin synthase QueD [Proteobacteria bacterium]|nr:6-carboxytetrahydropterin synthase QueD [Pseudomonadota bacterium]
MFQISRDCVFSASHQLRGYKGKCERLHGHNWRVRVHLAANALDESGMVIDFHDLDRIMTEAIEPFEHQHLNEIPPFNEINPSAENMALIICERVQERIQDPMINIHCCDVWENDLSMARYIPDGKK